MQIFTIKFVLAACFLIAAINAEDLLSDRKAIIFYKMKTTQRHNIDDKAKAAAAEINPKPHNVDLVEPARNLRKIIFVDHSFYKSALLCNKTCFKKHWSNITGSSNRIVVHPTLSNVPPHHAYREYSLRIELPFEFPFYGHYLRSITVSTEGYVYTGTIGEHGFGAEQHIAPLMANFDLSMDDNSGIILYEEATRVTILWQNMVVRQEPHVKFTFAATLYKNGDIYFSYKDVPIKIQDIGDGTYSAFVGLADSYILNEVTNYIRHKTLHNYSRIPFHLYNIENNSILYLIAQPSCPMYNSCTTCTGHEAIYGNFKCEWCESIRKCSSGADFYRPYTAEYPFTESCNQTIDTDENGESKKSTHLGFFSYIL